MLHTIFEYCLNIFYNLSTMLLEALNFQYVASKRHDTDMAKFLIKNSEKLDGKNLNAKVPIQLAVYFTKEAVLEFLAKKGAKANGYWMGETVLHIAAKRGYTFCLKVEPL